MPYRRNEGPRGGGRPRRKVYVRGVRRDTPDLKKMSQALIALATAQLEAEAEAEHTKRFGRGRNGGSDVA
jgi:hypothetical protein